MKKTFMFLAAVLIMVITGCGGGGSDAIPPPASSLKAITAFSLGGVAGTINETAKTIAVAMPHDTDVTALIATFTTTGSSVIVGSTVQVSGTTANNFTSPVTYTVTAADSSTQDYTVVVTVALSSSKEITTFSLNGVIGTINETGKTIAVSMPFGTNVTSLIATFTTTGASVKVGSTLQITGITPNNFTSPVTYTVTAADSSTQDYTVVVTVAASPAKAITAFSLAGVVGTINETGKTIAVTMPYSTNVTSLVATFSTTGSSVKVGSTVQISGTTAHNFTSPVTYTVTAADATTQDYTVTVTVALSSSVVLTSPLGGNITQNSKLTLANSPYTVTSTIQVLEGITLEIDPGVIIKFNNNTSLNVGGELIAIGTSNNIITFTSNQSTPQAGDWNGIKFFSTAVGANFDSNNNYISGSAISYAQIAYATYAPGYGGSTAALNGGNTPLFIDNSTIEFSKYNAIFINASNSEITNNIIIANSLGSGKICNDGIVSVYSDSLYMKNNTIDNNGDIGIYLHSSNNHVLNNKVTNNGCGIKVYGSNSEIKGNLITNNSFAGIYYYGDSSNTIQGNNIINNNDSGIYLYEHNGEELTGITNNNIYGNENYNIKLDSSSSDVEVPNNYWGTTDSSLIANKIYDYYDNISLGKVNYQPIANSEILDAEVQ